MDRNLFIGYLVLLGLALLVIAVQSVLYKALLFIPLTFATLAWIGYYSDYKERQDK
tara:strand:- start:249 stop:416 length:168 start_codon:yes stop_codon:yes gene_type:complete